jgi:hypothetical protein
LELSFKVSWCHDNEIFLFAATYIT